MSEFRMEGGGTMLNFDRDFCPRHLAAYEGERPSASWMAIVLLFDAFVSDPRVQEMAGYSEALGTLADTERIPALIVECGPLCCFVGDEISEEIRVEAIAGEGPRLAAMKARRNPQE